ncbi:sugar phosphorylase [Thiothrix nivea]|uniref:Alpha amylase catalytic region n=1 Tax=Thiothrix nivea (strain ATCC 35100 / DSM 5205 / JP2) TaxID=870187 RepID=A0A656HIJ3_THINJ|nr:sugar phosphorylase [Thiothrix nivea]EIJ35039.1 alpha amylase catalytic region [Thiothrix nivea DSM 5205]
MGYEQTEAERFQNLLEHLGFLYGDETAVEVWKELLTLIDKHRTASGCKPYKVRWDEQDIVLITYGDSIRNPAEKAALRTLKGFADRWLQEAFNVIHLLPIFPYTSDDGFSVADFRSVRTDLGNWQDVSELGRHFSLMFDFVLNHCSRVSLYFADFRANREPYIDFFIYEDPDKDWSQVVRPRSSPLLTEIPTREGMRHVWTTFSADQVDLNYRNPRVLLEMLDILLFYIGQGSRITRLDAIAFLWKEAGTSCLHLPQTHTVVKLMRDVAELVCPGALLLTETNVPHTENISYFGQGDEAHMVYQFSLPPLLLHAIHTGSTQYLYQWLRNLSPPPEGCTYFNFTASHDGIGVRPLEGLLPPDELRQLLDDMRAKGAYVSTRRNTDGKNVPYEINITYFDAFRNSGNRSAPWQVSRFLLSQTVALSMRGIPGIYIHSLLATPNDYERVEVTGATRSINRHQWDEDELEALLEVPESSTSLLLREYLRRIRLRRAQAAFHPDGLQEVVDVGDQLLMLIRAAPDHSQKIVALFNFTKTPRKLDMHRVQAVLGDPGQWWDVLYDCPPEHDTDGLLLKPYDCHWLTPR